MDASYYLTRKLFIRREELIDALSSPEFYVGLMLVGIALALAWLVAGLIRRRVEFHLKTKPPKKIDAEFISRPLVLLGPLLALIYLSVLKPIVEEFSENVGWIDALIQLTLAWLLARVVLMIVHSRPMARFIAAVIMVMAVLDVTGFLRSVSGFLNAMAFDVGQFHLSMLGLIRGGVILVIVFWVAGTLSGTLESYLRRSSRLSYNSRELTVKFFRLFVYFVALMITLSAMGVDLTAFAVFGGALGVGIGLGLQKITANFVSGITLLMEKSIQIGDLIEVGGSTGRVRQLNIRYALMETADGREVMIPNDELLSTRVTNWTHSSNAARLDVMVNVDYRSDPQKVVELMVEAAREHRFCLKDPPPACYLREYGDNALKFLLVFWIPDVREGRMLPQSEVMISILEKFRKAGIGIPCAAANNQVGNL